MKGKEEWNETAWRAQWRRAGCGEEKRGIQEEEGEAKQEEDTLLTCC